MRPTQNDHQRDRPDEFNEVARAADAAVGLPQPDVHRIDDAIEDALAEERVVGLVVLIAQDGTCVYQRAAGLADREASVPMSCDALFRLASLTKPIVATAALALVEARSLSLDDSVSRWLPEFRPRLATGEAPAITVRHLLTHTAGLSYGFLQPRDGPYVRAGVSDGLAEPGLSMREEIRRLASVPLFFAPGMAWTYSLAMDVLGEVLTRIAKAPLPEIVRALVTGPLGLEDTGFAVPDRRRLATPYVDGTPPRRMRDPDSVPFAYGPGIRICPSRAFDEGSFPSAGAGMTGTAVEFLKFLETLRLGGGTILRPYSVRSMMHNQTGALRVNLEATPAWGFGFGGAVLLDAATADVPQAAGTWKWGGVYGHHWYVDPVNRLTVVVLSNTAMEGMTGKVARDLMMATYGAAPLARGHAAGGTRT